MLVFANREKYHREPLSPDRGAGYPRSPDGVSRWRIMEELLPRILKHSGSPVVTRAIGDTVSRDS